jgi:hypothetical protein
MFVFFWKGAGRLGGRFRDGGKRLQALADQASLDGAFALQPLANELAGPADGFRLLAGALFRGLLIEFPAFHFPERAFALHLLLERAQGLLDIIVADNDLNQGTTLLFRPKKADRRLEAGQAAR